MLFAKNTRRPKQNVFNLASESEKVGLKLNSKNSKAMTNGYKSSINVEESRISYVEEYTYLGQLISPTENINKEIERKIANSWSTGAQKYNER